jgi:hypothetical protein
MCLDVLLKYIWVWLEGSHGTSRIWGDISKYLDANMNVSTPSLKNCACVDQVQFCTMGNKRHHTLASYGSNGRLGAKVSMFQWWALRRMNVFWDKAIGHTWTSGDHGVAFERFCKQLVHLVQF